MSDVFQNEGATPSPAHADWLKTNKALQELVVPEGTSITIHMVHVNHLDLTWYWRLPDTIEMCMETIRWQNDLLEAHPDMRYSHTQAITLRIVEQTDPVQFERFRQFVASGQATLDSGQVTEPDHNLPDGESLARQFLYGQRYYRDRFGKISTVMINSDSFGHPRSMPQILTQSGIRAFFFKRPRERYVHLPESPFFWKGIDGTTILSLRFINKGWGMPTLSQYYTLPEGRTELQEKVDRNLAVGVHHFLGCHCCSDTGGVAPYRHPGSGKGWEVRYDLPEVLVANLEKHNPDLQVIDKPLNYLFEGCYTTHIDMKQLNRQAERSLRQVEFLSSLASMAGLAYPAGDLVDLWWRAAYGQFHDVLPGTGSPEAHRDAQGVFHELLLKTNVLLRRAQIFIERAVQPDRKATEDAAIRRILVANPHHAATNEPTCIDVEMPLSRQNPDCNSLAREGTLVDDDGRRIPYQIVDVRKYQRYARGQMLIPPINPAQPVYSAGRLCTPSSVHFRERNRTTVKRLHRPAQPVHAPRAVPIYSKAVSPHALGVRQMYCMEDQTETPDWPLVVTPEYIENEYLKVGVGGPGIIDSIITTRDGKETLQSTCDPVRLELWPETRYRGDYTSSMKAWMLGVTDHVAVPTPAAATQIVETGPVRATLRRQYTWLNSTFVVDISLYAGTDFVELRFDIDWQELEVLCRLCCRPALGDQVHRSYGIPFGTEIATGEEVEVPAIGWIDTSDAERGFALLNQDRSGSSLQDNALRSSLVRCATGNHDPRTDSGRIVGTIRLLPHSGSAADADVPHRAATFMHPPIAWQACGAAYGGDTVVPSTTGNVLQGNAPFSIVGNGVRLTAFKRAEDGQGYIVRLVEYQGRQQQVTLIFESLQPASVHVTNLLEDITLDVTLSPDTQRCTLSFGPYEIKTLLLRTAEPVDTQPAPSDNIFSGG